MKTFTYTDEHLGSPPPRRLGIARFFVLGLLAGVAGAVVVLAFAADNHEHRIQALERAQSLYAVERDKISLMARSNWDDLREREKLERGELPAVSGDWSDVVSLGEGE